MRVGDTRSTKHYLRWYKIDKPSNQVCITVCCLIHIYGSMCWCCCCDFQIFSIPEGMDWMENVETKSNDVQKKEAILSFVYVYNISSVYITSHMHWMCFSIQSKCLSFFPISWRLHFFIANSIKLAWIYVVRYDVIYDVRMPSHLKLKSFVHFQFLFGWWQWPVLGQHQ